MAFGKYNPAQHAQHFLKETKSSSTEKSSRTNKPLRKRLPSVSKKRLEDNKLYESAKRKWRKVREALDGFRCEVVRDGTRCSRKAAPNPHHIQGRVGAMLSKLSNFLACCQGCHDYIHANPKWAYEKGYLKLRN